MHLNATLMIFIITIFVILIYQLYILISNGGSIRDILITIVENEKKIAESLLINHELNEKIIVKIRELEYEIRDSSKSIRERINDFHDQFQKHVLKSKEEECTKKVDKKKK